MATTTTQLVQEIVAGSTTFQAWVRASTAAEATKRVFRYAVPGADESELDVNHGIVRPYCLVEGIRKSRSSLTGAFASGDAFIMFEADVTDEQKFDHDAAMEAWEIKMDAIVSDIMALGRTGGYLMVKDVDDLEIPQRESAPNQQDAHISQRMVLTWGPR